MFVYIVMVEDKHCEPDISVFSDRAKAVEYFQKEYNFYGNEEPLDIDKLEKQLDEGRDFHTYVYGDENGIPLKGRR